MSKPRITLRLDKPVLAKLKRLSQQHKQPINQVVTDLIRGESHPQSNISIYSQLESTIAELQKTLCITRNISFETLVLLRLNTQQSYPDLIDRAEESRKSRYPIVEDAPETTIKQDSGESQT